MCGSQWLAFINFFKKSIVIQIVSYKSQSQAKGPSLCRACCQHGRDEIHDATNWKKSQKSMIF